MPVEREAPTLDVAANELLADDLVAWAREQGAQVEVRTAEALFELAFAAAADIGRDLGRAAVGGGSDGSFASSVRCATLGGMGACGDGPHTVGEHIRIADSVDKAAILARLLATP